jgi:hypothetical protein
LVHPNQRVRELFADLCQMRTTADLQELSPTIGKFKIQDKKAGSDMITMGVQYHRRKRTNAGHWQMINQVNGFDDDIAAEFYDSVRTAALSIAEQTEITGGSGYGVSWELADDIASDGEAYLRVCTKHLNQNEVDAIKKYIYETMQLPVDEKSARGLGVGLEHPSWAEHRLRSIEILRILQAHIRKVYQQLDLSTEWLDQLLCRK